VRFVFNPLIWNLPSRQPVGKPLAGHGDSANGLAISPDGKTLLSAGRDNTIRQWKLDVNIWIERACRLASYELPVAESWYTCRDRSDRSN